MAKVSILATDKNNFWGSNVSMGVRFQGELRFSGSLDTPRDLTRKLQRGRFIAHDNRVIRAGIVIEPGVIDAATAARRTA